VLLLCLQLSSGCTRTGEAEMTQQEKQQQLGNMQAAETHILLTVVDTYLCWPCRFKTSLCNQGPTCDRPICFFAHKVSPQALVATTQPIHPLAVALQDEMQLWQNLWPAGVQLCTAAAAGSRPLYAWHAARYTYCAASTCCRTRKCGVWHMA
jgi:hypothetical protein